ncbi:MAG TPA: amidohydrolase family protein [Acidimicrobiales bacterium]|nr:amidohydrolase family protein [Acidimicrobiales bacterium]
MDLLLRDATVVDGSGAPGRPADVGVAGDRIRAVAPPGQLEVPAGGIEVHLDGLVLAPGFIDVHTHYDAQILWDPDLTPSSWHGVTSVIMGNCGFGVAPTRPEHRDLVVRTLENVEGMSMDALNAGIDWCFESFPGYLSAIEHRPKRINVGGFVGHSPLRLFVMGPEERPARPDELEFMRELVREAVEAGAIGLSTSRAPQHQGAFGRPVPSRFADVNEVFALSSVLGELGKGVVQVAVGPGVFIEELSELAVANERPVTWTALLARAERPGAALRTLARASALPGEVYPQLACREIVMQINLADPTPLAEIDEWKEVLARPREERAEVYRDAEWRDRARKPTLERWRHRWARMAVQETAVHRDVVGTPLEQVAAERDTNPFDLMLDLALTDEMATRFRIVMDNDGYDELGDLLADKRTLLGLSDAGAHASQLCDACFSTHLLSHWVRDRRSLSIEDAVWRLTGHPHQAFRLVDRGRVREGYFADLVAFDPTTVGITAPERVHDQPGGADRLVVRSTGIEHVWVNGQAIWRDGEALPGVAPGRLLRS